MSGSEPDNVFNSGAAKLLSFHQTVNGWLTGRETIPICVEIQPTERCNHRCPDCQAKYALPRREVRRRAQSGTDLDLELLKSLWDELPRGVVISGNTGDPLIYPQLVPLLNELRQRSIPTVLICNGEGMNPEIASAAVSTCKGIRVSLDAFDPTSFRRSHGVQGESWERVLAGLQLLLDARRETEATSSCLIGVGYLTDERTRPGMTKATRLARASGVDYIQFRPYHYRKGDVEAELDECRSLRTEAFEVLSSSQKYRADSDVRSYATCHGASFYTVIDAAGDVYMCCHHVGNPNARLGSLRETVWRELLASEARGRVMTAFRLGNCPPLCRLHSQNEALEEIRLTGVVPRVNLTGTALEHRMFL